MDLCNINDIKALLSRHGFRFSKSMGQNFLIEDWVPRDIADASGAAPGVGVVEVGPGPPQLHFEQEIISSNRKKKNFTLVCITIIQVISVQLGFPQVLIFSFNGILVSILLIVAEKIKQKHGGFLYEAVE